MRALALLALLGAAAPAARAHNVPYARLNLSLREDGLAGTLWAHLPAPDRGAWEPGGGFPLGPRVPGLVSPGVRSLLEEGLSLEADGRPLPVEASEAEYDPSGDSLRVAFSARWAKPPGTLKVRCRPFPGSRSYVTYLTVERPGAPPQPPAVLDADRPEAEVRVGIYASRAHAFLAFLRQGVRHIFIGPDHIAFILGLILLGGSFLRLATIVTAFTLAHSVTLALAALGIVQPPARLIEPLIALSIVWVGVENLRASGGGPDRRAWIAFAFGFVHGFGFASVLREFGLPRTLMGLSLLSFNAGVELGQLCIVLAALPLLSLARTRVPAVRAPWGRKGPVAVRFEDALSCGIVLTGAYWLAQRILGFG